MKIYTPLKIDKNLFKYTKKYFFKISTQIMVLTGKKEIDLIGKY